MVVCNCCKGKKIKVQVWIDPNSAEARKRIETGFYLVLSKDEGKVWCDNCRDEVESIKLYNEGEGE